MSIGKSNKIARDPESGVNIKRDDKAIKVREQETGIGRGDRQMKDLVVGAQTRVDKVEI